jgi:asparagine synthase (glutamine-hydrolysing)
VPACVALSGGIDSALIARLIAEPPLLEQVSEFVTIGFEEPGCDESSRASDIARAVGVEERHAVVRFPQEHLFDLLRECIEQASAPLEHPHYLSYFVLCRHASRVSKVLITGEGADELFMGYDHYAAGAGSFAFREYLASEDEARFTSVDGGDRPFDSIRRDARIAPLRTRALASRELSRESELKSHLLTLLARNDKMGMAHSVEIRAPFLDREIVAHALSLSAADLVVNGSGKYPLKRIFAERFPGMATQPRKIGFRVPFDEMFLEHRTSAELRRWCERAARALREECGLNLLENDATAPRLGWSLLNIGMFLEIHS